MYPDLSIYYLQKNSNYEAKCINGGGGGVEGLHNIIDWSLIIFTNLKKQKQMW